MFQKIDAHQHFWHYAPEAFDWINEEMAVIRRDFLPGDLKPELDAAGYDGCVAVQAPQTEAETEFLLGLAAQHDFIRGVVGWVDLRAGNAEERLAHFAQFPKLVGVRHIVQAEPDDEFLLDPAFSRGVGLLGQFNLTYDILIYPRHLPVAARFAARFPNQPFVLDHLAKPFIKDHQIEPWARHLRELAQHENVYCKLSGMVTEADWLVWDRDDFTPYLDVALEAFGPGRLMIGSDWPVCKVAAGYGEVMALVEEYISRLSPTENAAILGENAIRFYRLQS
jgi:L-fuconolactonase